MKDQSILQFCRYYHGENIPPTKDKCLWGYEQKWVELTKLASKDNQQGRYANSMLDGYLDGYLRDGLGRFREQDDTPVFLKALLYNRFKHFGGDADAFKDWYKHEYYKES